MKVKILFIVFCSFLAIACGSSKQIKMAREMAEMQQPVVMAKTEKDKRPDWCTQDTHWEKDGKLYYTGGYMGGADYSLTLRIAKSEAIKNLIESASIKAREEFSHSMQGSNMGSEDIGRYVTDSVGWTIENLRVSGIKQKEMYYEEVFSPVRASKAYNAWVLLEISRDDYLKAKLAAAGKLVDKAIEENNLEAKEKAEEILGKLQ